MNCSFEFMANLQYKLKALRAEIRSFQSGEKYVKIQKEHQNEVDHLTHKNKELSEKLEHSHIELIISRNQWFEVFEDMQKESDRKLKQAEKEIQYWKKKAFQAEKQLDEAITKAKEQRLHIYEIETALEDEKGKVLKLTAQMNRDYENSSLPSSKVSA